MEIFRRFLFLTLLFVVAGLQAFSQSPPSSGDYNLERFELGGHFTVLRRSDANPSFELFQRSGFVDPAAKPDVVNEIGVGARFTYNLSKMLAFEIEANLFPEDKTAVPINGVPIRVLEPGGRKIQVVAGPKVGWRNDKFGVFGKVRPGLLRIDRYRAVIAVGTPENFFVLSETRSKVGFLNVDVGGVFEYYPSRKTVFRVDVGDTIIHYRKLPPKEINPSMTRHNFQMSVGFAFRF